MGNGESSNCQDQGARAAYDQHQDPERTEGGQAEQDVFDALDHVQLHDLKELWTLALQPTPERAYERRGDSAVFQLYAPSRR